MKTKRSSWLLLPRLRAPPVEGSKKTDLRNPENTEVINNSVSTFFWAKTVRKNSHSAPINGKVFHRIIQKHWIFKADFKDRSRKYRLFVFKSFLIFRF